MPINKTKTPRKKQGHHITRDPEWIVPLNGWQHKVVSIMEHLNATEENLQASIHFQNAVNHQVLRLTYQLYAARKGNLNP